MRAVNAVLARGWRVDGLWMLHVGVSEFGWRLGRSAAHQQSADRTCSAAHDPRGFSRFDDGMIDKLPNRGTAVTMDHAL